VAETWYRTWGTFNEIVPVEVVKATDRSVWVEREGRVQRTGAWREYWRTWDEAQAALIKAAENEVAMATLTLEQARAKLAAAKALRSTVTLPQGPQ
jgi:hypothetical protein